MFDCRPVHSFLIIFSSLCKSSRLFSRFHITTYFLWSWFCFQKFWKTCDFLNTNCIHQFIMPCSIFYKHKKLHINEFKATFSQSKQPHSKFIPNIVKQFQEWKAHTSKIKEIGIWSRCSCSSFIIFIHDVKQG